MANIFILLCIIFIRRFKFNVNINLDIKKMKNRTVLLIWAVLCYSASIADKEKTVLCHFLSAPRLMKKVAERIFIAPPKL